MLQGQALLYTITMLTAMGFMLIGYDNGVMGGVINEPPFQETFFPNGPDAALLGTVVAIYEIGCFVGALLCAAFGEMLGRRKSIFVGIVLMLAGTAFQAAISSNGAMIGARIVSGLGMGFINSTVPVLQAEVSPKASRGRFVCFQLTLLNFGIMMAYWVGYGFVGVTGSKAWRIPVALQAIFQVPILILVFIVPESPRWLAAHGRAEESLSVLARLQGKPTTHESVLNQHHEIQAAVELEHSLGSGKWSELLREDAIKSRRRLIIACSIQFFQQIGGINALIYYAGNFIGLVSDKPALIAGALFTWFALASFIPWALIDTLGRRKLLLICISGMAICFAAETGLVWSVQTTGSKASGGAALAFLFLYMSLFTIGFQAVVWVYPSEILPLGLRQKGSAISTACNWITNYAIVQMTPPAIENLGYKFYIVFAVINAAFLPPIYFFYPETKGLSLEQVDLLFADGHPASFDQAAVEIKGTSQHLDEVDRVGSSKGQAVDMEKV